MTTSQVVETSVTVNNNSPIQDYVHQDDHAQLTYEMTPGFKPFTIQNLVVRKMPKFGLRVLSTSHLFLISVVQPAPLVLSLKQHCFTLNVACRLVIKG